MTEIFKNFAEAMANEIERDLQAEHGEAVRFWRNMFSRRGRSKEPIMFIDNKGMNAPDYLDKDYEQDGIVQRDIWTEDGDNV